jgi:mRNA interferase YafQ
MLKIEYTTVFLKDYKKMKKKHFEMDKLEKVLNFLVNQEVDELLRVYKDHALKGNWQGYRELHIEKDWLLIYKIEANQLILTLTRTGKHGDIL